MLRYGEGARDRSEVPIMGRVSGGELILIALIALLLFGASRLSDIGKGLGEGIKNFKKGLRDDEGPKQIELTATATKELEANLEPEKKS